MKEVFSKDIKERKEFVFQDTVLKQLEYCEETGRYLYGRYWQKDCTPDFVGKLMGYEIVKPVKHKNPDGNIVLVYPSTEQFGSYGWFLPANSKRTEIEDCLNARGRFAR